MTTARWNKPFAAGIVSSVDTLRAPPDWPMIVTLLGIPAELLDVVAHPFQRMHDIEHAERRRLLEVLTRDLAQVRVAEHVQAVIHRHRDHVAAQSEVRAVVHRRGAGAGVEAAAVAPDHHGPLAAVIDAGRPDVERRGSLRSRATGRRALLVGLARGAGSRCGNTVPYASVSRTPVHFAGSAGGMKRLPPAVLAPYGMP